MAVLQFISSGLPKVIEHNALISHNELLLKSKLIRKNIFPQYDVFMTYLFFTTEMYVRITFVFLLQSISYIVRVKGY